jgi:hypothetical protein
MTWARARSVYFSGAASAMMSSPLSRMMSWLSAAISAPLPKFGCDHFRSSVWKFTHASVLGPVLVPSMR